ncbi:MAG: hypothetical protein GY820_00360, partial [Gammaproteobacteria bacterium]|nr:hypothetical protein [Gammaproteobacteria bacterium]
MLSRRVHGRCSEAPYSRGERKRTKSWRSTLIPSRRLKSRQAITQGEAPSRTQTRGTTTATARLPTPPPLPPPPRARGDPVHEPPLPPGTGRGVACGGASSFDCAGTDCAVGSGEWAEPPHSPWTLRRRGPKMGIFCTFFERRQEHRGPCSCA